MASSGESGRPRLGWPLQVYFVALAGVFVLVGAAAGAYVYVESNANDRQTATADANFAARKAANEIAAGFDVIQKANTAGASRLDAEFANPAGCHHGFASIGAFEKGRIDLVRADGSVICTSEASLPSGKPYAGETWLQAGGTVVIAPLNDPETGHQAVVISYAVRNLGALVWVIELAPVGPRLSTEYGSGVNQLEFLVTTPDGKTIITRSIDADIWTGANLAGTPFATSPDPVDRADVTGTRRWYGESTVPSLGWKVYAGADQAAAMTAASRLQQQEFGIIAIGVVLTLLVLAFVYRQVVRPVAALSGALRSSSRGLDSAPVPVAGPAEVAGLGEDINNLLASLKHEWHERESAQRRYSRLFEGSPLPMTVTDPKTLQLIDANDAAASLFGYTREELKALHGTDLYMPTEESERQAVSNISIIDRHGTNYVKAGPLSFRKKDGSIVRAMVTSYEVDFGGYSAFVATIEDVTEKEKLESRFRQAERLESLGQLAGGVAHDFNNLLAVILNVTASLKSQAKQAIDAGEANSVDELRDIERIEKAGQSAARLTRQLLAFARREVVQPSVLDVGEQVQGLIELLRRTLGSHLELKTSLAPDLWPVLMDAGHLEQVVINLAVNARDAMAKGGTLLISTRNVTVDDAYAGSNPGLRPGRHVELKVADTGSGMDTSTLEHIFEPFFTTKPVGKGTGLGLATVYGIVKQVGGHVSVYSEVGRGTTITVLLPATDEEVAAKAQPTPVVQRQAGTGTVLVVEDYPELRQLVEEILTGNGYRVFSAADGAAALALAREHAGEVDIVLTDIVMPNMLGTDLAAQLKVENRNLRVLFMSGHAQPALGGAAALPPDVQLLQKPFMGGELLDKLKEVLAAPPYGGGKATS
jgi:PAS domain S-box-containing protein